MPDKGCVDCIPHHVMAAGGGKKYGNILLNIRSYNGTQNWHL